jgi:hypothetical protein
MMRKPEIARQNQLQTMCQSLAIKPLSNQVPAACLPRDKIRPAGVAVRHAEPISKQQTKIHLADSSAPHAPRRHNMRVIVCQILCQARDPLWPGIGYKIQQRQKKLHLLHQKTT